MKVAIPKELAEHERRVAATPDTVKSMLKAGLSVAVESGAGTLSAISDQQYEKAGATVVSDIQTLLGDADVVLKVQAPAQRDDVNRHELDLCKAGAVLIGLLQPRTNPELVTKLAGQNITAFSLDLVPRIARAQKLDALSSQSNVAGYKAVLMAADRLPKMMPMMMTAAGTITPARVFVLGAGVAGLQAIATAKRLGAVVHAFDTRPVVKEQVESLGGKFVQLELDEDNAEDTGGYAKELSEEEHRKEQALVQQYVHDADIVITTAAIPGKPAPKLITEDGVKGMKAGSVIVDLAAETGGNCVLTEPGQEVVKHGVTIVGLLNIPSLVPTHASLLYAKNVSNFLLDICKDGELALDLDDEVVSGSLVTHNGTSRMAS